MSAAAAAATTPLTLFYWPINFRGHFVKSLLRYAGREFAEAPPSDLVALKNAPVSAGNAAIFMAPPVLKDGDLYISQTPAILAHLGRQCGLSPANPHKLALCDMVVGNCGDIINELTRGCGMKRWDNIDVSDFEAFVSGRFSRWLQIVEAIAVREGLEANGGFYLGTDSATYADTTIFAVFATMSKCLPLLEPVLRSHMPCVMALCDRLVQSNAGLQLLMSDTSADRYCGGFIEKSIRATLAASSLAPKEDESKN